MVLGYCAAFACAARGDVARAARVAFTMLLEGFRARDGFLALQSRAEYNAAAAAAGEVSERAWDVMKLTGKLVHT